MNTIGSFTVFDEKAFDKNELLIIGEKRYVLESVCKNMVHRFYKEMTSDYYLSVLPPHTRNGEIYGLKVMVCNGDKWNATYYSHFTNESDDSIPQFIGDSPLECLKMMHAWFLENRPETLLTNV